MPLRKMKQKKFKGIYEYYKGSDHDKQTTAYYISVRDSEGKPKKIKTDAKTPEEAVTALAHYKATRTKPNVIQNNKLTLDALATWYFNEKRKSDKRRYEIHVSPVLGDMLVSKITENHLEGLQKHLHTKKVPKHLGAIEERLLSNKSINLITDLLSGMLTYGHKKKKVEQILPKLERLPVDNDRQRIFTDDELKWIFDNTEGYVHMFVQLMYYTGQRPESILRLQRKHITDTDIYISPIKKQKENWVPISQKLREVLVPWIDQLEPNDYIISQSSSPTNYQAVQARIIRLFKGFNKGLNYKDDLKQWASLYTLRHTALTNIYKHTGDILIAKSIANHVDLKMTERYTKIADEQKLNAVEGL